MAAYESWAGGTISGGAEATSSSLRPSGGYVPVAEIPNAPKTVEMPLAQYPAIPAIRHEYLKMDIDMESRARKLQRPDLPGSFEQASKIRAEAGRQTGTAIAKIGTDIGESVGAISGVLAKLHYKATEDTDKGNLLRGEVLGKDYSERLKAMQDSNPPEAWYTEKQKLDKEYRTGIEALMANTSDKFKRDTLDLSSSSRVKSAEYGQQAEFSKHKMQQNYDFGFQALAAARKNNDPVGADKAVDYLHSIDAINDDRAKLERDNNVLMQRQNLETTAANMNPWDLKEQTDSLMKGGESKDFGYLKDNPERLQQINAVARNMVNQKEKDGSSQYEQELAAGKIKFEDREKRAKELHAVPRDVASANKAADDPDPAYDPGIKTKLETRLSTYDPSSMPTELKDRKEFYALKADIRKLPKNMRADFEERLNDKIDAAEKGKPPEVAETTRKMTFDYLDKMATGDPKTGIFGDDGTNHQTGKDFKIDDPAKYAIHTAKVEAVQYGMDVFYKKNPGASIGDINQEFDKLVREQMGKAGTGVEVYQQFQKGMPTTKMTLEMIEQEAKRVEENRPPTAIPKMDMPTGYPVKELEQGPNTPAYPSVPGMTRPPVTPLGGKLSGQETVFSSAAQRYGLDPRLLTAISQHETGNGTSDMLREKNNPGGLYDSKKGEYMSFPTLEAGVDAMAKTLKTNFIDKGLTTIEQIQAGNATQGGYAPVGAANDPKGLNKDWVRGVKSFYGQPTTSATGERPRIDTRSAEQIATLTPAAQPVMTSFVARAKEWAKANGVEVVVTEGYRTPEKQAEYYAQGRTKPGPIITNAKPGQSRHQSARAIDVMITKNGKEAPDSYWRKLGQLGKQMGLVWGGDFKSIYDPNHFQFNA